MDILKNLPFAADKPAALKDIVSAAPHSVASKALSRSSDAQLTLLSFADGEAVSEEEYFGDTLYISVDGTAVITDPFGSHVIPEGSCFAVPAHTEHAVKGIGPFKILQITVR